MTQEQLVEHRPVAPWFDTQMVALQVLATLDNREAESIFPRKEDRPEKLRGVDITGGIPEDVRSIAPRLEAMSLAKANNILSEEAEKTLQAELESMAEDIIQNMPEAELEALAREELEALRAHYAREDLKA